MFCWDWYLQHSKGLYTTFSPIKAVSFFTQTTKCLFWVSSQMATAWSDPLETADNNYILNSSTIPQLQAYKPQFEYGEKSHSFITFWKGTDFGSTDTDITAVCLQRQTSSTSMHKTALQQQTTWVIPTGLQVSNEKSPRSGSDSAQSSDISLQI